MDIARANRFAGLDQQIASIIMRAVPLGNMLVLDFREPVSNAAISVADQRLCANLILSNRGKYLDPQEIVKNHTHDEANAHDAIRRVPETDIRFLGRVPWHDEDEQTYRGRQDESTVPRLEWCRRETFLLAAVTDVIHANYHEEYEDRVRVRAQVDEEVERISERQR